MYVDNFFFINSDTITFYFTDYYRSLLQVKIFHKLCNFFLIQNNLFLKYKNKYKDFSNCGRLKTTKKRIRETNVGDRVRRHRKYIRDKKYRIEQA